MVMMAVCFALVVMTVAATEVYAADNRNGASGSTALSRQLQSAWSDIQEKLDLILERRDKEAELPEASIVPRVFGDTKESNRKKIGKLLEDLTQSMLSSPAYENLQAIRRAETEIAEQREKERRLRNDAFSAPVTRPIYRIDLSTADELRKKAAECAAAIAQSRQEIQQRRQMIAAELSSWGVELSPEQQELLFSSVIGDDMLQNSIILKNVRSVLEQMAASISSDTRDPLAPKRYYGSYLSFIDILIESNRTTLANIQTVWQPRLSAIMKKARETIAGAKRGIVAGGYRPEQVKALEANIRANQLTIKVGGLYRDFLNKQAKEVQKRIADLEIDRTASQNTYDTVTVSSNLSELIQRGLRDLDALEDIILPEMRIFENFEQQREFAELSSRMMSE